MWSCILAIYNEKDVRSLHQSDFYILNDNSYKNAFKFPFLNIF